MKTKINYINRIANLLFIALIFGATFQGVAKKITYVGDETLNVGEVIKDATIHAEDDNYLLMLSNPNWQNSFKYESVVNRIILSIDNKNKNYQADDYTAEVTVQIKRQIWDGTGFIEFDEPRVLTVDYKKNGKYTDKSILQFQGGNVLDVEVLSITSNSANPVMNLKLEAQIYVECYEKLDLTIIPVIKHDANYVSSRNELEVEWDFIHGAEEYELEWTYVNNLAENGTYLDPALVNIDPKIFRQNNTRVSLIDRSEHGGTNVKFRIPLIYEQGFILYRIRPIGTHLDDVSRIVAGAWSSQNMNFTNVSQFTAATNNYYYNAIGHEERINWQSSVTFIEDGKNKIAVSYADGTLRSRQQVSRLNTQNETVVGESIYDHQGRKAIDIIPAPTGKQKIEYTPDFNKNTELVETGYNKEQFDLDGVDKCENKIEPLSEASGAGNYYSKSNAEKSGRDAYIPDAKGYPFIQTVYTNDNTGRISAQGGIGADHQIGSGHETKNYYGKPLQTEIDRMFGSEAGAAAHYQKNLVVDPNGQVTVSYLDLQGNVVATSLAGVTPLMLKELESQKNSSIEENLFLPQYNSRGELIDVQHISKDGKSKEFNQEFLVSEDFVERNFKYTLKPEILSLSCTKDDVVDNICFECVYNLEILLEDKCGTQFFITPELGTDGKTVVGQTILTAIQQGNLIDVQSCSPREVTDFETDVSVTNLVIGDYTISKVLTVNTQVLDYYTEEYVKLSCHKTLEDFNAEKVAEVDLSTCGQDCGECITRLGDYDQYDINVTPECDPCLSYTEYQSKVDLCNEQCESDPVTCDVLYTTMLMDVTPLGQYGELYNGQVETMEPETAELSIYNVNNKLPANSNNVGNWRNPSHWQKDANDANHYYDENGNISYVDVKITCIACDGTAANYTQSPQTTRVITALGTGVIKVEPQELLEIEDFVAVWQESWATSLVSYHPEFEAYGYCIEEIVSHTFDEILNQSTSRDDFKTRYDLWTKNTDISVDQCYDLAGSATTNAVVAIDPYFINNADNKHYSAVEHGFMNQFVNSYKGGYTLEEFAHISTYCPQATDIGPCSEIDDCVADLVSNGGTDEKWLAFKSMYLSLKQRLQERKRIIYSINNGYYSGCIGMEKWSAFSGDYFGAFSARSDQGRFNLFHPSQFYNLDQPCSQFSYMLYQKKRAVSVSQLQLMSKIDPELAVEECYVPADEANGVYENQYFDQDCKVKDDKIMDRNLAVANKGIVDACGECPITRHIETLLNGIVKEDPSGLVNTAPTTLGCFPIGLGEWTSLLETEIGITVSTVAPFTFFGTANGANNLIGTIDNGSGDPCDIELAFMSSYDYLDYNDQTRKSIPAVNWEDLKSICCMSYATSHDVLTHIPGKSFTFYATIDVLHSDDVIREEKIKIEGNTNTFILNDCADTICNGSQVGSDLLNLFNVLLYEGGDSAHTPPVVYPSLFNESTEVTLAWGTHEAQYVLVTDLLKDVLISNSTDTITHCTWKFTSVDNLNASAELKGYRADGIGSILIDFVTADGEVIDFTDIKSFIQLSPDAVVAAATNPYDTKSFIVSVVMNDGTRRDLVGSSTAFIVGECEVFGYGITTTN
jgi:hypothetical protein